MLWYVNQAWKKGTLQFQQLQMQSMLEDKLEVLRKLAITGPAPRLPALWSLQYLPEEKKVAVRVSSDLSGLCYHTPIEIGTGHPVLAKHGGAFKAGLSTLWTVASEALSLPRINTAIDAAKSGSGQKLNHSQRIHNLIERLKVDTSSSAFDSKTAKFSPAAASAVLHDLLTSPALPPSAALSPTASASSSHTVKNASILTLSLCVESVTGLTDWDWFKTYCKWQLFYGDKSATPIASGAAVQNADGTASRSRASAKTTIASVTTVEMLRECRLVVQVKRRSRIGWTKLIGEGKVSLCDVVDISAKQTPHFDAFQVPLDAVTPAKRFVTIQLASET